MSGWQRFFLLFLFCIGILICWPQYDTKGITFMSMAFVLWTCIIMLFSVIVNLFAINKFEFLHRLFSIAFLLAMLGSLLYYFPLQNNETPYIRLRQQQWPTKGDIELGMKRLTFSYDFVNKNVEQNHPLKDQLDNMGRIKQEIQRKSQQVEETLEIFVKEDEEENK